MHLSNDGGIQTTRIFIDGIKSMKVEGCKHECQDHRVRHRGGSTQTIGGRQ